MTRGIPGLIVLLVINGSAAAFTNDTLIQVIRHCSAESVSAGDTLQVFFTIDNDQSSDLHGFFLSDQIPAPLKLLNARVRIDGSTLAGCLPEKGYPGDVYEGTTPHRWVVEEPDGFGERTSIPSGGTVEIEYMLECHGSGVYFFENYSWAAGMIQESDTVWAFGYDTGSFLLFVEGNDGCMFIRGDANTSGSVTVADAVHVLRDLYIPEGDFLYCLDAADSDDDGELTMEDAISMLKSVAVPGVDLPPPSPDCGLDPTPDYLDCLMYSPCASGN